VFLLRVEMIALTVSSTTPAQKKDRDHNFDTIIRMRIHGQNVDRATVRLAEKRSFLSKDVQGDF
jgi:hypothetical protein